MEEVGGSLTCAACPTVPNCLRETERDQERRGEGEGMLSSSYMGCKAGTHLQVPCLQKACLSVLSPSPSFPPTECHESEERVNSAGRHKEEQGKMMDGGGRSETGQEILNALLPPSSCPQTPSKLSQVGRGEGREGLNGEGEGEEWNRMERIRIIMVWQECRQC